MSLLSPSDRPRLSGGLDWSYNGTYPAAGDRYAPWSPWPARPSARTEQRPDAGASSARAGCRATGDGRWAMSKMRGRAAPEPEAPDLKAVAKEWAELKHLSGSGSGYFTLLLVDQVYNT